MSICVFTLVLVDLMTQASFRQYTKMKMIR